MKKSAPPKIVKLPAAKQRRLDELLDRNSESAITPKEKAKLAELVAEAEQLMVANSKRLATFAHNHESPRLRRGAPVTVWVQSEATGH